MKDEDEMLRKSAKRIDVVLDVVLDVEPKKKAWGKKWSLSGMCEVFMVFCG